MALAFWFSEGPAQEAGPCQWPWLWGKSKNDGVFAIHREYEKRLGHFHLTRLAMSRINRLVAPVNGSVSSTSCLLTLRGLSLIKKMLHNPRKVVRCMSVVTGAANIQARRPWLTEPKVRNSCTKNPTTGHYYSAMGASEADRRQTLSVAH